MIKPRLLALLAFTSFTTAHAFDLGLLANNKESVSKVIKNKQEKSALRWSYQFASKEEALQKAKSTLKQALNQFEKRDAYCDVGFVQLLKDRATKNEIIIGSENFAAYVAFLRVEGIIDDIFYTNILKSDDLNAALADVSTSRPVLPPVNRVNDDTKNLDVTKLYSDFKTWPDEVSKCSIGTYYRMMLTLKWKNKRERDALLNRLNYLAMDRKVISVEVYNKLEVIREKHALDWNANVKSYLDVVKNAKDKLSPSGKPENDPSKYSTTYVERKEKLTQRGRLYRQFDSTQILILSEIIQKTAKRMDAHYVAINFQYENKPDSEIETYVLSPMERYRLSIKLLRKDLGEVQRSELFRNNTVEYEDLVTAAYETGLIKSEELELILKFEAFWNPREEKWKIYANFAFSILGTASFYLPPPWNIIGAIALVVTQTQINKKQQKADPDDNWNVVI
jgi:hypothetical protein